MNPTSQMDYKLLFRSNADLLSEDVAELTYRGYKLVGGVAVFTDRSGKPVFVQAVAAELE